MNDEDRVYRWMTHLMFNGDHDTWIIKLIAEVTGVDQERISLGSRLNHDLRIDGDDAAELISEFAEAFNIDMTEFQFEKYFRGEPTLFNWWVPSQVAKLTPVTVRDLVEAARQKKWIAHGVRNEGDTHLHEPERPEST